MFQKVTQKVWFVVLVGLLLGLACGAVMARWPSLRGVAVGVAVVGALLLGRATRRLTWFAVGVAPVAAAFAFAANHRWSFPIALVVAVASLVVGGIWGLWEAVRRRGESEPLETPEALEFRKTWAVLLSKLRRQRVAQQRERELFGRRGVRPNGGCEHANCAAECAERNRNGSVSEVERLERNSPFANCPPPDPAVIARRNAMTRSLLEKIDFYRTEWRRVVDLPDEQVLSYALPDAVSAIDENAQIERLARLLHDAGRSAVEPSGAFVEWDNASEQTRAGWRSQAAYLLAAGVSLPGDSALDRIAADVAELRRLAEPAKLTIPPSSVTVKGREEATK